MMPYIEKHPHDEEEEPFLSSTTKPTKSRTRLTCIVLIALVLSVIVNIILILPPDLDSTCIHHTSRYASPITDDIPIKYKTVKYDGRFNKSTVYRLPPGKEVDDAWMALGVRNDPFVVPEDKAEHYGINPGATKVVPEQGGGFPVLFEFDHHLHCLNLLRMSFWFNYPHYQAIGEGPFGDDIETLKTHTTHCLDILRQFVMCNADMTVYGQYWVKDLDRPFVDFNTEHTCKDFEVLKEWAGLHQHKGLKVEYREGDVLLDTTP